MSDTFVLRRDQHGNTYGAFGPFPSSAEAHAFMESAERVEPDRRFSILYLNKVKRVPEPQPEVRHGWEYAGKFAPDPRRA